MPVSIQALRERRVSMSKELRNLVDNHTGSAWGAEQQSKYDELARDIESTDAEIARNQRVLDEAAHEFGRTQNRADQGGISTDEAHANVTMEKSIFNTWLREGKDALNEQQRQYVAHRAASVRNDMSTDVASGGYLVPTDFATQLIEALKAFGGMRQIATVIGTGNGQQIQWPTVDSTAQEGEIVGQNTLVGAEDFAFGMKEINAYKFSSKSVAVPIELLQDSRIDLEGYIHTALATRIARITERKYIQGTGTNEPQGALVAAAVGATAADVADVQYTDLVELEHSVDPAYRSSPKVRWQFHDQTLKGLKKLKDGYGRPLWLPGIAVKEPDTILGYQYTINQYMPTAAANAKTVLFGDFTNYLIRDVMQVMLFRMTDSNFTMKGQVGFLAFYRGDAGSIDVGGAWKSLQQAAA
ncbi:phage major capsid protein [Paraburkholderia fungorum]|uniref:phage major capsid protein n=1 Tax=Paraburkholderia fungorum TaxID=134537 RepID=UPI0038BE1B2C